MPPPRIFTHSESTQQQYLCSSQFLRILYPSLHFITRGPNKHTHPELTSSYPGTVDSKLKSRTLLRHVGLLLLCHNFSICFLVHLRFIIAIRHYLSLWYDGKQHNTITRNYHVNMTKGFLLLYFAYKYLQLKY